MKKKYLIGLNFVLVTLISCSPAELKPNDYIRWCDDPDHNLVKEFSQNNIVLTCQYTSPEYVSLKQSDPSSIVESEIRENIDALSEMVHFKLTFEDTTSNNFLQNNYTTPEEFNLKSMYISYDIQYDLKLVQNGDTAQCAMNHHERTYGSTPYETVLISFPKLQQTTTDLELIFNDRVFGLGRVKFFFTASELDAIPKLIF